MDKRLTALTDWIQTLEAQQKLKLNEGWQILPLCGDASYRRYFRLIDGSGDNRGPNSWVLMDAPPQQGDSHGFVAIANAWGAQRITVPRVEQADLQQGFLLLSDLGCQHYLDCLNDESADRLYTEAIDTLIRIQGAAVIEQHPLPLYDRAFLQRELDIFPEWFLQGLLTLPSEPGIQQLYQDVSEFLIEEALGQPRVCMHRDYHSRNLMVQPQGTPAVIDFQDAVLGPISYDVVSLLRDCYVSWSDEQIDRWIDLYLERAEQAGLPVPKERTVFLRWFDHMGMQRHLKAIGIFARLMIRDGKPGYLADIPRTLSYVLKVCDRYTELSRFGGWLRAEVVPAMDRLDCFGDESAAAVTPEPVAAAIKNASPCRETGS